MIFKEQASASEKETFETKGADSFYPQWKTASLGVITEEVREFLSTQNHIVAHTITPDTDPLSLVGRHIIHLFEDKDSEKDHWYEGYILNYIPQSNQYAVAYVEEEETYYFDLSEEIKGGDLKFLNV